MRVRSGNPGIDRAARPRRGVIALPYGPSACTPRGRVVVAREAVENRTVLRERPTHSTWTDASRGRALCGSQPALREWFGAPLGLVPGLACHHEISNSLCEILADAEGIEPTTSASGDQCTIAFSLHFPGFCDSTEGAVARETVPFCALTGLVIPAPRRATRVGRHRG